MIIINQTTAEQLMANWTSLRQIQDVMGRNYLLGLGAEILVVADDSDLVTRLQAQQNKKKGVVQ